jgi:uncharacterized protein (DUF169 family)
MTLSQNQHDSLERLRLAHPPVAVAFLAAPPEGLAHIDRPLPAGCSYWKEASDGRAFYTTAADHQNCAVGAFTHGVTLSPEKAAELNSLIGTMVELRYIRSDEVPSIPHRTSPMEVAAYAPLGSATFEPDVVVFRGNARQIMLMSEAARSAGVFDAGAAMGRPACAMLPQATGTAAGVASVACIGNRVYTGLGDDELYFAVPGKALTRVLEQLRDILDANRALETFHRQRAAALGSSEN